MQRIWKPILSCLLGALIHLPGLAQAPVASAPARPASAVDLNSRLKAIEAEPRQFEASYKIGRKAAAVCANCHGEGGNSPRSDTPNLAGQNTAYLLDQVRQFSEGRRKNEFMEGIMRALSVDEKIGVAIFYANQTVVHKPAADAALAAKGKSYYDRTCFRCHGELGMGSEKFARVAGQQKDYLTAQLRRYREGKGPRIDPLMAANARNMTDADIDAVVAYVSSMK